VFGASWLLLIVLAPTLFFVHRWQKVKLADSLLKKSEEYRTKKEWNEAIAYMDQYLRYREDDTARRVERVELLDHVADDPWAIQNLVTQYLTAIGLCESDPQLKKKVPELRRALITRQMQFQNYEDAVQQIARLAGKEEDSGIVRLLAICRIALASNNRQDQWDETSKSIAPEWIWPLGAMNPIDLAVIALESSPGDPDLTRSLADAVLNDRVLLQNSKLANESEEILNQRLESWLQPLLDRNPDDPEAWLTYVGIVNSIDPERAAASVAKSVDLFPDNKDVLKTASQFHLERAQAATTADQKEYRASEFALAKELLLRLRDSQDKRQSKDPTVFSFLGDIESEQGNTEQAAQIWDEGISKAFPPTAFLHFRKVRYLIERGNSGSALAALKSMDEAIRRESINVSSAALDPLFKTSKQLWGAYYITQSDYVSVARMLNEVAVGNADRTPAFRAEILAALATACLNASQWDRAAAAFEQAIDLVPDAPSYRRGAAEAWFRANRLSDSLRQWQAINPRTAEDWFQIAIVSLSMQLQGIPEQATWTIFDEALQNAKTLQDARMTDGTDSKRSIQPWQLEIMQLESQVLRMNEEGRAERLSSISDRVFELCREFPSDEDLWRQSSILMRRWNRNEDVERLSKLFLEANPQSAAAVLEKAQALAAQNDLDGAEQLLLEQLNRSRLDDVVLRALFRLSPSPAHHSDLIDRLLVWSGQDALRLKQLGDLAVQLPILEPGQDESEFSRVKKSIERWSTPRIEIENRLRQIEGEEGSEWRWLKARRLLAQSEVDLSLGLEAADEIVRYLKIERPQWVSTHVLDGLLAERRREASKAIQAYEKAIALGEDSPSIYERLINLLRTEGLVDQAKEIIQRLGLKAFQSNQISAAAMEMANSDESRLFELAKLGIETRPKDPMAWVWYAQILDVQSRLLNAEERQVQIEKIDAALTRAEELSEGREVRVFNAAYEFYTATNQTEKIDAMLERIRASTALPADIQWLFLAIAQQARGNLEIAESYYRLAAKSGGDPREIGMLLSKLLLQQGKIDECIDRLEKMRMDFPSDYAIRESLARVLAIRGLQSDWDSLQKMFLDTQNANSTKDRRALSKLLAKRGLPSDVEQAKILLEDILLDPSQKTAEDSFRLASIYTSLAKGLPNAPESPSEAKRLLQLTENQLKQTTLGSTAKPEYLLTYGNFLLTQGRAKDAEEISKRLSTMAPRSSEAMQLRAMVMDANDQREAGIQFVRDWMTAQQSSLPSNSNPALENQILGQSANVLYLIHASSEATPIMNQIMERDSALWLSLLYSLCQAKEPHVHSIAFDQFLTAFQSNLRRDLAFSLMRLIRTGRFQEEQLQQAETLLSQFEKEHPEDSEFRIYLADHWIAKRDNDRAIASLKAAIEIEPKNVFALNNLANLVAEKPNGTEEAIGYIDRAIEEGGKQTNLLDSKGCILLEAGRFAEAIPSLQEAAAQGIDPRIKLHWYMALRGAGKTSEAERLRPQIDLKALGVTFLSAIDQAAVQELSK
jgi:predicted Zn-dependent protease